MSGNLSYLQEFFDGFDGIFLLSPPVFLAWVLSLKWLFDCCNNCKCTEALSMPPRSSCTDAASLPELTLLSTFSCRISAGVASCCCVGVAIDIMPNSSWLYAMPASKEEEANIRKMVFLNMIACFSGKFATKGSIKAWLNPLEISASSGMSRPLPVRANIARTILRKSAKFNN